MPALFCTVVFEEGDSMGVGLVDENSANAADALLALSEGLFLEIEYFDEHEN